MIDHVGSAASGAYIDFSTPWPHNVVNEILQTCYGGEHLQYRPWCNSISIYYTSCISPCIIMQDDIPSPKPCKKETGHDAQGPLSLSDISGNNIVGLQGLK